MHDQDKLKPKYSFINRQYHCRAYDCENKTGGYSLTLCDRCFLERLQKDTYKNVGANSFVQTELLLDIKILLDAIYGVQSRKATSPTTTTFGEIDL